MDNTDNDVNKAILEELRLVNVNLGRLIIAVERNGGSVGPGETTSRPQLALDIEERIRKAREEATAKVAKWKR